MNVYTPDQVAEKLHLNIQTVRKWLRTGELTGSRTPAGWRVSDADIDAWLARYQRTSHHTNPETAR